APRSVYGRSKLGGEREVARHAGSWAIARTSWVFGRRGRNFVDTIVGRARDGAPLKVVDDQRGCPTYAPDLAGALARLAVERRPGRGRPGGGPGGGGRREGGAASTPDRPSSGSRPASASTPWRCARAWSRSATATTSSSSMPTMTRSRPRSARFLSPGSPSPWP